MVKLTSLNTHMAFAEGEGIVTLLVYLKGVTDPILIDAPPDYAFCLDDEEDWGDGRIYGGGRGDCCDDTVRLAPEPLALCRIIRNSRPLYSGWNWSWEFSSP